MSRLDLTRRQLAALLSGIAVLRPAGGLAAPGDNGIGGTGAVPDAQDRGIGGTGVIGTIRQFGSIIVNDLRISYPESVAVRIDGLRARRTDLRIGHVVEVLADARGGGLSTNAIAVTSEVVGPVERVVPGALMVLGQTVVPVVAQAKVGWKVGDRVAVSGLRRTDGVIEASLIERRSGSGLRVAGPARRLAGGDVAIGNLTLRGLDPALVGTRVVVDGVASGAVLRVTHATQPLRAFANRPALQLSIETFVGPVGGLLQSGSGFALRSQGGAPSRETHAILTARQTGSGPITIEELRSNGPGSDLFRPDVGRQNSSPDFGGRGAGGAPSSLPGARPSDGLDGGIPGGGPPVNGGSPGGGSGFGRGR